MAKASYPRFDKRGYKPMRESRRDRRDVPFYKTARQDAGAPGKSAI